MYLTLPTPNPSALLLLAVLLPGGVAAPSSALPPPPPNIIFLFTDDQRFDALGFLHQVLDTPNLDQLAHMGVRFTNAFVTTPICPSSRATVLTGLHEQTHQFTFLSPGLNLRFLEESYPKLLREAGYYVGFIGKNGANLDGQRAGLLFDEFVVVTRTPYIQVREGEEVHATDFTARKAVDFIRDQSTNVPFALTVWFNAPHAEDSDPVQFIPPTRYADRYAGIDYPDPPASDADFFLSQPEFLQASLNRVRWHWRWTPELYDQMMSGYLAMVKGVDDAIGEIVQELEAQGIADHTVLIFMSDNGYFVGERGFAGKWLAYEPSIRSPLIIYDPRTDAGLQGRELTQLVLNIDLPETILDLAGIPIPVAMQGRSLVPLLDGEEPPWRQDFFIEHHFTLPPAAVIPQHESLRTEHQKYIHYIEHDYEELYDLRIDPHEEDNLAGDPAYQEDLARLRERARELKKRYAGILFVDGFESGDTLAWSAATSGVTRLPSRP